MDHEYSISGRLWVDDAELVLLSLGCQEYAVGDIVFRLLVATAKEISLVLKDKSLAPSISDNEIAELCSELSKIFGARVRMERLHEEYGLLNVFNGGSDYEVVTAERFACECENGREISCSRQKI